MNRVGYLLLNIAVALFLFANGILGFSKQGVFTGVAGSIFSGSLAGIVVIILSVIALIAGALMILQLFKLAIPNIELIMLIIVIVWVVFIVIVDVINPLQRGFPPFLYYLTQLSANLMVLGALIAASKND